MRKGTLKKALALALTGAVLVGAFAGCGAKKDSGDKKETKKIVIGASPSPHADNLKVAKKELKKEGYELEIKEYSDYVQPNTALESGDLDANYFQHKPYLDDFNKQKKIHLVSAGTIHYEPFGIYPGTKKSLDELEDGDTIAVPNDTTNEARALLLLTAARRARRRVLRPPVMLLLRAKRNPKSRPTVNRSPLRLKTTLNPQRGLPLPPKQKPAGKPFSVCPHRLGRREGAGCSVKRSRSPGCPVRAL